MITELSVIVFHVEKCYAYNVVVVFCSKVKPSFRWKPEPRRLLTEEEYQKQGEVETHQALEELRKYCTSPEFNTWKTVSRLQSPKRLEWIPIPLDVCHASVSNSDVFLKHAMPSLFTMPFHTKFQMNNDSMDL